MRLGDLGNTQAGGTPSSKHPEFFTGTIPWIGTTALNGGLLDESNAVKMITEEAVAKSATKIVPAGSIMVGIRVGVGKVAINAVPMCTSQDIVSITGIDTDQWNKEYISLALQYKAPILASQAQGATITGITSKTLKSITIPVLALSSQNVVVSQLRGIDRQIACAKKRLEFLGILVKSRFAEMFGDPAENTMSWDTISLTSLGGCKNGMNFKSRESGIELPCLGVGDFKDRAFINGVSEMGRVSLDSMPAEDYFLRDGDIVFVRSNGNKELVGRCLAVFPDGEKAVYSGFCIRLRVESDQVRIPYLIWALRHPSMRRQMFGRGANVQNLNQKMMAKVMIPIPPLSRQDCFLDFAAEVDKSRFVVRNKSQL